MEGLCLIGFFAMLGLGGLLLFAYALGRAAYAGDEALTKATGIDHHNS